LVEHATENRSVAGSIPALGTIPLSTFHSLQTMTDRGPITVSAFYKFVRVEDPAELKAALVPLVTRLGIKGSILIAREGINATISGVDAAVRELVAFLRADARFADLISKESYTSGYPFKRMKVRLKSEIVTLGAPEADPTDRAGTYVPPKKWNALISEPGVVLVDTRNDYEVKIGTFKGARDPGIKTFGAFRDYVKTHLDPERDTRVAMFCTGGIRCEKSTAYLLAHGFKEVYHLEGGILKYLEEVPKDDSLWEGECFVFDERVALDHGVVAGSHRMCPACGHPVPADAAACENCARKSAAASAS
jgi:UPF0176 protein